jgi:selenocysteine-specific elongation factor
MNRQQTDGFSSAASLSAANTFPPDPDAVLNVNVGVLGHIDSGKTSLVKALSTLMSTASLDKSRESRERGMTLDLGFSCFFMDMPDHLSSLFPHKTALQITLVDCPGHASLIRTIIGGAHIIDMALLVIDSCKGWQAQTTECLALAELTCPYLVVALNKADLFPLKEREQEILKASNEVRRHLSKVDRFADAPIIGVAACVGGEKVAAVSDATDSLRLSSLASSLPVPTWQLDRLVDELQRVMPVPRRSSTLSLETQSRPTNPFHFSIDHCFPIRGRGTVLTGTVLNGSLSVGEVIEFPELGFERKVKSIQMFKRSVSAIHQGDRAGICVANLDAKLVERGIAATPAAVPLLKGAIALVRKVPWYGGVLKCGTKFHVSVGHTTVMATVNFWGAREISDRLNGHIASDDLGNADAAAADLATRNGKSRIAPYSTMLGGDADMAGLPKLSFRFEEDFLHQDSFLESLDSKSEGQDEMAVVHQAPLHWASLVFQTPVHCPLDSLIIASRLDVSDTNGSTRSGGDDHATCRLSFSGRLVAKFDYESDNSRIRMYHPKDRRGAIAKLGDPHRRIDDGKLVRYEVIGDGLFKKETNMKLFLGMKVTTETGDVGEIKAAYGTGGQFRVAFAGGTEAQIGDTLILPFKRYTHDPTKSMHQEIPLPTARPGIVVEEEPKPKKNKKKKHLPKGVNREGEVLSLKGDLLDNGLHGFAIIDGLFSPEINIREYTGATIYIPATRETGNVAASFGKAGKCKASFPNGISASAVGAKVELQL